MWKKILVAVLTASAILAVLFGSGVLSVKKRGRDASGRPTTDPGSAKAEAAKLDTLAYVGAVPQRPEDRGKRGVVMHDAARSSGGLNLVTPCGWGRKAQTIGLKKPLRVTRLMDMDGKILHQWTHDYPDSEPGRERPSRRGWANAKLGPDGHLHVVHARTGFLKLDWDSNLLWGRDEFYHHDFDFLPDGTVVALVEDMRTIEFDGESHDILDNGLAFISPDGELLRTMWFYDLLRDEQVFIDAMRAKVKSRRRDRERAKGSSHDVVDDAEEMDDDEEGDEPGERTVSTTHHGRLGGMDIFHANTVEVLSSGLEGTWEEGDIMTSFRQMDTIAVFDDETGALRWHWGKGRLDRQHDPSLLPDKTVLIFDNGMRRKRSRLLRVDPLEGKVVWKWDGPEGERFFSYMRGQVQPLESGNLMVVESERGRVFELDARGDIVWDYFTTDVYAGHVISLRVTRVQGPALESLEARLREEENSRNAEAP